MRPGWGSDPATRVRKTRKAMKKGSEQTYEVLKKRIVAGHYTAGTQLKEEHIAEDIGVSRTPVRAALKRLIDDGLAVQESGRGVFVAGFTRWDIEDMFRLRIRLEPFAARLAAERADAAVIARLKQCNQEMAGAIEGARDSESGIEAVQAANSRFHRLLLDAAGSQRLKTILETMIDMPIITRSFFLYEYADLLRSLQHHRDIAMAVELHDGDLAEQLMSVHLLVSNQRFMSRRLDNFDTPSSVQK
ncbi:GntR family transcriptional regulator [Cupriavidus plantarum]|uniref:GntR family transcriptional regulator n=2 Tax=Cupriavidus plantarum TaxID=942865 RepID=A0A316ESV7_9BURK|nr:GntR family transcriptional regulator [Cupriavidus plantarum]REE89263.1 GntR family transcriptional regulator [Cupriavidus plantarum]RLK31717.1 GntR family transcriptional regulator [Cupriavidus plantarum]CAG2139376.1 HTH-type transcriptional repressor RspR [Cupriavidus plantarum]SMR85728.1 transcriptional regulator, GntR family [Cupriavidus plantarum]